MCPKPMHSYRSALKKTNCYVYFLREKIEEGILGKVRVTVPSIYERKRSYYLY